MHRFGYVVLPDDNRYGSIKHIAGVANGMCTLHGNYEESSNHHKAPPPAVFYDSAEARDVEMQAMAKKFPGFLFAPIEVTSAQKYQVAKEPTHFIIDKRGVLPA
jgi:hypothetical protein